jgi:hypothetical protein
MLLGRRTWKWRSVIIITLGRHHMADILNCISSSWSQFSRIQGWSCSSPNTPRSTQAPDSLFIYRCRIQRCVGQGVVLLPKRSGQARHGTRGELEGRTGGHPDLYVFPMISFCSSSSDVVYADLLAATVGAFILENCQQLRRAHKSPASCFVSSPTPPSLAVPSRFQPEKALSNITGHTRLFKLLLTNRWVLGGRYKLSASESQKAHEKVVRGCRGRATS